MPQYVGYDPWHDAAQYGAGLGQALTQAFQGMPQQRYEMALGVAQMGARQQALVAQQQRQEAMERQNEQLRQVQMQEAQARTAAAQAQLGKINQPPPVKPKDTIDIIKGEGGVPIGYFDYTLKKYTPFGSGGGQGLGQKPPAPITQNQQYEDFGNLLSKYNGAQANGWQTNNPAIFGALSNAVLNLGRQLGAAPTNAAPQLGVPQQAPAQVPFQLTNQPAAPQVRRFNPATGQLE